MDKKFILHAPIKKIGEIVKHFGDRDDIAYVFIGSKIPWIDTILSFYRGLSNYIWHLPCEEEETESIYINRISEKLSIIDKNIVITSVDRQFSAFPIVIAVKVDGMGNHYGLWPAYYKNPCI